VIAYLFIPGPEKWTFVIGGPLCGGFAFAIIYFLLTLEIKSGPYFEYYPQEVLVRLPRYNAEVKLEDINCLQWITGGSKNGDVDRYTDLNLIVRSNEAEKRRYFLLGTSNRKIAMLISEKIGIPVTEIVLGAQGKRDIDAGTAS
jgi:hypothetical protein